MVVSFYNKNNKYYNIDGTLISNEEIIKRFPQIETGALLYLDGVTPVGTASYDYLISKYNIEANDKMEGLRKINECIYYNSTESTPLERIASALESICVLLMPNKEVHDEL